MSNFDEKYYLEKCKAAMEKALDIGESTNWKQRDYEYLCEQLLDKTKTNISLSTIKRIWNDEFKTTPQPATLNALAIFLGYNDWNTFKKAVTVPEERKTIGNKNENRKPHNFKKVVFIVLLAATVISSAIIIYSTLKQKKIDGNLSAIKFSLKKTDTTFPNSVVFDYDVSAISPQKLTIQQSWDKRMTIEADPKGNCRTCIYYYPGFYTAKLIGDDKLLKETKLMLNTTGWLPLVIYQFWDSIPVYIHNTDFSTKNEIHLSPEEVQKNGVNIDKEYHTLFSMAKDFGLSSDNFQFETKVKNSINDGALVCQRAWIMIIGETGWFNIPLSAKGCISDIDLTCSENYWNGKNYDLSAFGCDMNQWHCLKLENRNRNLNINLDEKLIFNTTYRHDIGNITEICYVFKGCGAFKDILLKKTDGRIVYKFPNIH